MQQLKKQLGNITLVLLFCLLQSCASNRGGEAPQAYLSPAGWQNLEEALSQDDFESYASQVKHDLMRFRVPFEVARASAEVDMASPAEFAPAEECESPRGIALLVHGLSDTAFAMRDLAQVLSSACYISRTVLLPGHGTRPGDLLTTRLNHWEKTISYLVDQAAAESDTVLLAGFSLGAVLTLVEAHRNDKVDGLIALSPAYFLSTYRLARWTPFIRPFKKWIDRGLPDDAMRYEAMPTRGVVETVKAMQKMHRVMKKNPKIKIPWLLAQSMDDAVTVPEQNKEFFLAHASHPASRSISFHSTPTPLSNPDRSGDTRSIFISGVSSSMRVDALTHLAIHVAPGNHHYGITGRYRNCGTTAPRDQTLVENCLQADKVWYGLWGAKPPGGRAQAMSTFNPSFDEFAREIVMFVKQL